jgi:hypothetical protein
MSPDDYVSTSITKALLPRMKRTHERRRISVFSGPPGIGKSTTIEQFRADEDPCVGVVAVPPGPNGGIKPVAAMQLAIEALRQAGADGMHSPASHTAQRRCIFNLVCRWAGIDPHAFRHGGDAWAPPLTLVFDEAQNLSREAIEALRFLNDSNGGYSPFPLGLVFVGNSEFVLKSNGRAQSVLSAAVSDRILYDVTFIYPDVTDDDLALFLETRGLTDPGALQLFLDHFRARRPDRSFRRATDLLDELADEAAGGPITADTVRSVIDLAA